MDASDGDEIELDLGLSLVPKYEVEFTFFRKEVAPPVIDEWQLKETLIEVMKRQAKFTLPNDRDLRVQKEQNLQRKRREEPVAKGTLTLLGPAQMAGATATLIQKKLSGLELRVAGVKLICQTSLGAPVTYMSMQEEWEKEYGPSLQGYKSRRPGDRPDTVCVKDLPPRWLAEPRVSPNPSVLVTHSLFSTFGTIRKLEIVGNADISKAAREAGGAGIAARLQCEVVVQYEDFSSFCKAVRAFVGRAMRKTGSSLVASYSVEWDQSDFFSEKNARQRRFEKEREADEERRRLVGEQRKREWAEKKVELARLEQERREAEERERVLREEEDRLKAEEAEAQRAEEERIRLEEERRREEEERVRAEEERLAREEWEAEQRRIREEEERREREAEEARLKEEEERRREEEQRRKREELEGRLKEEMRRVQWRKREVEEQATRRDRERQLRGQVEERMRDRVRRERSEEESRRREPTNERDPGGSREGRRRRDEGEEDRWRLDGTQSAASLDSVAALKRAAIELSQAQRREDEDRGGEEEEEEESRGKEEGAAEEDKGEGKGEGEAMEVEEEGKGREEEKVKEHEEEVEEEKEEEEEGKRKEERVGSDWIRASKRLRSTVVSVW